MAQYYGRVLYNPELVPLFYLFRVVTQYDSMTSSGHAQIKTRRFHHYNTVNGTCENKIQKKIFSNTAVICTRPQSQIFTIVFLSSKEL